MSARADILTRITQALANRPKPSPVPRHYRTGQGAGDVGRFAERVTDYAATVHHCGPDVADAVATVLAGRGITRVVVPDGFPAGWLPPVETVGEPCGVGRLDEVGAVLSTCAVAIAETGTVVLDAGEGMGARALTLVPDYHLVVVREDQIVADVPDALCQLDPRAPLTWVSGPSATSDIELVRVEGVHGPRTLDVLIATSTESTP